MRWRWIGGHEEKVMLFRWNVCWCMQIGMGSEVRWLIDVGGSGTLQFFL